MADKKIIILVIAFKAQKTIREVLDRISKEMWDKASEVLVIDDASPNPDTTYKIALNYKKTHNLEKLSVQKNTYNQGYGGNQKIGFNYALSKGYDIVAVLHGDGQYDPSLLKIFIPMINENYSIINGYRDKRTYPHREETPVITYCIIKILSWFESLITGYYQKEWHSGFVMYDTEFLRKIPLQFLSDTRHIDGEFLICAGILKENTKSLPIFKNYNGYESLTGLARVRHVVNVIRIILKFRRKYYHALLKNKNHDKINFKFDIIA